MDKKLVILDNGHGVDTPGKCSPDGKFREYKYAREIVKDLSERLTAEEIKTAVLVPEEKDISLAVRVKRANAICKKEPAILISVHVNAAAGDNKWHNATGWSAWTSVGQTESDKIADALYSAAVETLAPLKKTLRKDMSDGDPDWESNFYILKKTSCPAVLVENFFQDTKSDVEWLLSAEGRKAVVDIIVKGLKRYFRL